MQDQVWVGRQIDGQAGGTLRRPQSSSSHCAKVLEAASGCCSFGTHTQEPEDRSARAVRSGFGASPLYGVWMKLLYLPSVWCVW